jgi:Carboxypeptidase regulatory-like domain
MRVLFVTVIMGWFCFAGFGQSRTGSITGSVSDPAHKPAPDVTVEAKNIETGVFYKAKTSSMGEYTFAQLPVGTYEVSILRPRPFIRRDVTVTPGGSQRLDIQLSISVDANTLGELGDLFAVYAKRPPPPEGPTPRMADQRPDFSGVWIARQSDIVPLLISPPVDLLPWAEALVRERRLNQDRDRPSARCLPNHSRPN